MLDNSMGIALIETVLLLSMWGQDPRFTPAEVVVLRRLEQVKLSLYILINLGILYL